MLYPVGVGISALILFLSSAQSWGEHEPFIEINPNFQNDDGRMHCGNSFSFLYFIQLIFVIHRQHRMENASREPVLQ